MKKYNKYMKKNLQYGGNEDNIIIINAHGKLIPNSFIVLHENMNLYTISPSGILAMSERLFDKLGVMIKNNRDREGFLRGEIPPLIKNNTVILNHTNIIHDMNLTFYDQNINTIGIYDEPVSELRNGKVNLEVKTKNKDGTITSIDMDALLFEPNTPNNMKKTTLGNILFTFRKYAPHLLSRKIIIYSCRGFDNSLKEKEFESIRYESRNCGKELLDILQREPLWKKDFVHPLIKNKIEQIEKLNSFIFNKSGEEELINQAKNSIKIKQIELEELQNNPELNDFGLRTFSDIMNQEKKIYDYLDENLNSLFEITTYLKLKKPCGDLSTDELKKTCCINIFNFILGSYVKFLNFDQFKISGLSDIFCFNKMVEYEKKNNNGLITNIHREILNHENYFIGDLSNLKLNVNLSVLDNIYKSQLDEYLDFINRSSFMKTSDNEVKYFFTFYFYLKKRDLYYVFYDKNNNNTLNNLYVNKFIKTKLGYFPDFINQTN